MKNISINSKKKDSVKEKIVDKKGKSIGKLNKNFKEEKKEVPSK